MPRNFSNTADDTTLTFWTSVDPITLAQNDRVHWMLIYEAA